ncbi:hypothetical protein [Nocardioides jiangxiensis]|uniref:Uncharacterized protein n=1 Tax=Nocardioides jiangxiensis TaxID=3064524 RepID=A0ABT9B513_9ACTN|nr:hypothetical protein [Nocardioides sp. WY-20]MDO7869338.1 hypothetical protein [Nocardioides sp. WY-20]
MNASTGTREQRVRDQAREALAVMVLSAGLSIGCAMALVLLIAARGQV